MKINLFLLLLLVAVAQASAQVVEAPPANLRDIKLYRATVRTMSGEKISGIFYAMTDSTLVFFANNKAAIEQFRAGQPPELFMVDATNVKRLTIRQKEQLSRSLILGLGAGVVAFGIEILIMGKPVSNVLTQAVAFGVGYSVGLSLIPKEIERYKGNPNTFLRARSRLDQYTLVGQQRNLDIRTGTTR